jgi:hypothetical protein
MSVQIRKTTQIVDNKHISTITVVDVSNDDQRLLEKFGTPDIALGGAFENGSDDYTLPTRSEKLAKGAIFSEVFDRDDFEDPATAEARADAWLAIVVTRIGAALTTLRANTDTFTSDATETL